MDIIEIDDHTITPNNLSTIAENIMVSNNESTIVSLMTLRREQQRIASYNALQESAQLTLNKEQLIGGIDDLINHLCIGQPRVLLLGYLSMPNLPYTILDGINIRVSPPKTGERTNMLCIGLGYSRQLRNQWLSLDSPIESALVNVNPPSAMVLPALNDFTYPKLINDEITKYSDSVKRDFLRCMFLENLCSPCDIYSTNVCTDDIRSGDNLSEFEKNESASSRKFVQNLYDSSWQFDQIYVDHYRMFGPYIANSFTKQFFTNLKWIARMGLLKVNCKTLSGRGEIYLPFCPHFFINVISNNLYEEYDIDYIEECDINR